MDPKMQELLTEFDRVAALERGLMLNKATLRLSRNAGLATALVDKAIERLRQAVRSGRFVPQLGPRPARRSSMFAAKSASLIPPLTTAEMLARVLDYYVEFELNHVDLLTYAQAAMGNPEPALTRTDIELSQADATDFLIDEKKSARIPARTVVWWGLYSWLLGETRDEPTQTGYLGIAMFYTRNVEDARIAIDTAYEKVLEAMQSETYDPLKKDAGSLRGYLATSVRHTAEDMRRRKGLHTTYIKGEQARPARNVPDPVEIASTNENIEQLRDCIRKLPDRERNAIEARLAGLATEQIAANLGIKLGYARTIYSRALDMLRECMGVSKPKGSPHI